MTPEQLKELREKAMAGKKCDLPRIAISNPWAEYQVSLTTSETTAGEIYAPDHGISNHDIVHLVDALERERAVSGELEAAIREVGMNTIGVYHTNNNVSGYFKMALARVTEMRKEK